MDEVNVRSVRYPVPVDEKFEKIARKLGRTKRQVFIQMVDYFYKSKKDPADLSDELLRNTLLKQHKEYIAFIRTQETDLLIPTKRSVATMIESQRKLIELFNTQVLAQNNSLQHKQQQIMGSVTQADQLMKQILSRLQTREVLKQSFMLILNSYIQARESFSLITPAKEKEELINKTRKQVDLL